MDAGRCTVFFLIVFVLNLNLASTENTNYDIDNAERQSIKVNDIVLLKNDRIQRDTTDKVSTNSHFIQTPAVSIDNTTISLLSPTNASVASEISTGDLNKTVLMAKNNTSLLGFNATGILHVTIPSNTPTVSEPITPDEETPDVFINTLETIKAKKHLKDIEMDNHVFYNSTFYGNADFFNAYWANITKQKAEIHEVLSNSHRRATTTNLKFDFTFYGNTVRNITVATGGFIFIGDHIHYWLAATQFIAPLMANFDTTLGNNSVVKQYDDGEKFVVFWENVTLQENSTAPFTFAAVLHKNGDIAFVYKDIPFPIQNISDKEHPVKIGISDAYLTGQTYLHVRHKIVYEYHRISFKNYEITNNTVLMLFALPTCLGYDTCESCNNHETQFNCSWCKSINKCSSGIDKLKNVWEVHHCEANGIKEAKSCPASRNYNPKTQNSVSNTDISTEEQKARKLHNVVTPDVPVPKQHSAVGGVVAVLIVVTLLCSFAGWVLYAFKNPHTRSGQILIRYRPSQWSWRRGEARYTAATIHM